MYKKNHKLERNSESRWFKFTIELMFGSNGTDSY